MKTKHTLLAGVLTLALAASAQAELVEGKDYTVLSKPLPQLQSGKIEVTEFFGYFCVHCYHLEPVMQKHSKKWASDTYLRPLHVVWQPEMMGLARVAAAVNSSNMKYQANLPIFRAFYEEKINLADSATFKKWAAAQTSFDGAKLIAAYDSFGNQAQAKQMADLTVEMNIEGTPTIIVGGKYMMRFSGGDWNVSMNKVDEMIAKVRQERGMKAPAAKAAIGNTGAAIAKAANNKPLFLLFHTHRPSENIFRRPVSYLIIIRRQSSKLADNPFHHQSMLPTPPKRGSTATQQILPPPLRAMTNLQ